MFISFISIVLKHVQGEQESGDPIDGKYVAEAQYRAKVAVKGISVVSQGHHNAPLVIFGDSETLGDFQLVRTK